MTQFKKLSIIIPVYNEKKTLPTVLAAVGNVEIPLEKEIVLIDDFSTDGSRDILNHLANEAAGEDGHSRKKYKVVFLEKNQGKGVAVKRGFKEATGDIVLIQDADMEYTPNDYPELIRPIMEGRADVVYGSRFLPGSKNFKNSNRTVYLRGYLVSKGLNFMSNILSGVWLTDMYTCYKVFAKRTIDKIHPRLNSKRFGIDPELTAWVGKFNFRIIEVPVSYCGRTYEEGKKINWKDGIAAIWHIFKFNLLIRK